MVYAFFTSSPRPLQGLQLHGRYIREENQSMSSFYEKKNEYNTEDEEEKKESELERQRQET